MDDLSRALSAVNAWSEEEAKLKCLETVRTLLRNVIQHPTEAKFRRVRESNARFAASVLCVPGGRDLLLCAGFAREGENLVLPNAVGVTRARAVLAALERPDASLAAEVVVHSDRGVALSATPAGQPESADGAASAADATPMPGPATTSRCEGDMVAGNGAASATDEEGDEEDLALALSMSMDTDSARQRQPAPKTRARGYMSPDSPEAAGTAAPQEHLAAAGAAGGEASGNARKGLEDAIRQHFMRLVSEGVDPNDAALRALELARRDASPEVPLAAGPSAADERFVRFEAENVATAADKVDEINAFFAATGMAFVDPSFPPVAKSLYYSESSATQWKCPDCHRYNPAPTLPPVQQLFGPQGVAYREANRLRCGHCGAEAPLEMCLSRPTQWLSARVDSVRDDVSLQFVDSVPWKVFRDQPRPDDIRQGALGDCWFVCALSILAEEPSLIRRIFSPDGDPAHERSEFNPSGAYALRLCRAGEWHPVVVDDHFPATDLSTFAFSKAARRQLWVPLVEKAAAKLHGCYEALEAGTLAEALTMLTGYATERILLHRYRDPDHEDERLAASDPVKATALAALTPEQRTARAKQWEEDRKDREYDDVEELFHGLLSRKAAGFVIGAACVDRTARDLGLQAPHAYGVLELTTISLVAGEAGGDGGCEEVRLVKLRNPSGVSRWEGEWAPRSKRWTPEARRALGVDLEDAGVFWMSFDDFVTYFASCEVCRVRPELTEVRARGWLPSAFGPGEAVRITAFARTDLDLAVYQEGHSSRSGSQRTLLDLGMLVLKVPGGEAEDARGRAAVGPGRVRLLEWTKRANREEAFKNVTLELDAHESQCLAVPLCFNQFASTEPRRFIAAAHASQPVALEVVKADMKEVAAALIHLVVSYGETTRLGSTPVYLTSLRDDSGTIVVGENASDVLWKADLDCSASRGVVSSRGALFCEDVLPPLSAMVMMVVSAKPGSIDMGWSMSMAAGFAQSEGHIPPIGDGEQTNSVLHTPLPIANERVVELQNKTHLPREQVHGISAALAEAFRRRMEGSQQ